jgi:hypothetical protein
MVKQMKPRDSDLYALGKLDEAVRELVIGASRPTLPPAKGTIGAVVRALDLSKD